jgi:hypothetical protein
MGRFLLFIAFFASSSVACSKSEDKKTDDDGVVEEIDGKAKLDGKKVEIESCKAVKGDKDHEALELTLEGGMVINQDQLNGLTIDGKKVECSSQSSSGSGGTFGEKRWAKGKLKLECETKKGTLELDVTYDCGSKSRPTNLKQ